MALCLVKAVHSTVCPAIWKSPCPGRLACALVLKTLSPSLELLSSSKALASGINLKTRVVWKANIQRCGDFLGVTLSKTEKMLTNTLGLELLK